MEKKEEGLQVEYYERSKIGWYERKGKVCMCMEWNDLDGGEGTDNGWNGLINRVIRKTKERRKNY